MRLAAVDPTALVASAGAAAVLVLTFLQGLGAPVPSEVVMTYAGVLAGQGRLSLALAIAAGVAGDTAGSVVSWAVGRRGARPLVARFGRYVLVSTADLDRAEAWFGRRAVLASAVGRCVPLVRGYVGYAAGAAEVPLVRYALAAAAGNLVWDGGLAVAGYALAGSWRAVEHGFAAAGYVVGAAIVVVVAVGLRHRLRAYRAAERGD